MRNATYRLAERAGFDSTLFRKVLHRPKLSPNPFAARDLGLPTTTVHSDILRPFPTSVGTILAHSGGEVSLSATATAISISAPEEGK